jgi:hypothetical protein
MILYVYKIYIYKIISVCFYISYCLDVVVCSMVPCHAHQTLFYLTMNEKSDGDVLWDVNKRHLML